ncbi:DNA-binding transcriptional repressor DeoR [Actinobacillus genomosp. 2]|uniref:DNA-binding transcriptional repressor DeoR n=1 Tax=Actinobacillus genomosp. 2 TaxID=230709 RepID=UPI00244346DF|nr:DNA-binding transcriptional repressor DeoR [Actinobacillus genomosp. 2]WGE31740.1 DNA-binding transcriptional repressor DeoR [Actinobacillus genomosp. 2]
MDNKIQSRIQRLEFLLKKMDKVHLRDAADILNVSEMTIRRDINASAGSIVLLGGYIVRDPQKTNEANYQIFEQETKHIAEKMQIGSLAAKLVEDGDIVFFDCGSTIPFIASQIDPSVTFTAICCSINTFMVLQEKPNCQVILCGGNYSRHNSFMTPIQLTNELDVICTTKAFISAAGIDLKKGITCFNFEEAKTKQKAIAKTQQAILVFDHSKLHKIQKAYVGDFSQFDLCISDQELPEDFSKKFNIN